MRVFLSWSGEASHKIAQRLYDWLPMVIQKVQPYISSEIEKGTRWSSDIALELNNSTFGIACVTRENLSAPWLLFEAGAISKSVAEGRLAPVLFGIEQSDIQKSPLSQFQMTKFDRSEFFKLLSSINSAIGEGGLSDKILSDLFSALWPQLESDISKIIAESNKKFKDADAKDGGVDKFQGAIEEMLTAVRSINQIVSRPDRVLPERYLYEVLSSGGLLHEDVSGIENRRMRDALMFSRSMVNALRDKCKSQADVLSDLDMLGAAISDCLAMNKQSNYRLKRPVFRARINEEPSAAGIADSVSADEKTETNGGRG